MSKIKLVFATANKGKLVEAQEILGANFELVTPADLGIYDDIEETGDTLKENSILKARYVYERTGLDCFADDTGLEVDALGGAPGVHTARYAEMQARKKGIELPASHDFEANMDTLLKALSNCPSKARSASFRSVVTLILGGEEYFFEGHMEGHIAQTKSGTRGFGYDPVFIPKEYDGKTLAELSLEDKDAISHRGKALRAMAAWLSEKFAKNS